MDARDFPLKPPHIVARVKGIDADAATLVRWCKRGYILHVALPPGAAKPRYKIAVDGRGWPVWTKDAA